MIAMNPMAMAMGMGMNGFNPMGAQNSMNLMGGMNGMNAMNAMGGVRGLRIGMGPMGSIGLGNGLGAGSVGGLDHMGMGMRPAMGIVGSVNPSLNRLAMNGGPGPSRLTNRGQHHFHPYAR